MTETLGNWLLWTVASSLDLMIIRMGKARL